MPAVPRQDRAEAAASWLGSLRLGRRRVARRLQFDLRITLRRLEGEFRIGRMDREIPVGELGDKARFAWLRAIGDDQTAWQRLVGLFDPQLEFDPRRLGEQQMTARYAIDRHGVDLSARCDAGHK